MLDFFLEDNLAELSLQGQLEKGFDITKAHNTQNNNKLKVEQIFTAIEANLSDELVSKTGAIFQFNVKGKKLFIKSTLKQNLIHNRVVWYKCYR